MSKHRCIPSYQRHPTGQARVRINGKDYYLGKHGSPESHDKCDQLIEELVIGQQEKVAAKSLAAVLTAWWAEWKRRYKKGKGSYGGDGNWRPIIKLLCVNYGDKQADKLGPKLLRQLLETEAKAQDWTLTYPREQLSRVKMTYERAVSEELLDASGLVALKALKLRLGGGISTVRLGRQRCTDQDASSARKTIQAAKCCSAAT